MIKDRVKTLLQPSGRGGVRDRGCDFLWSVYARSHQLPMVRPGRRLQLPSAEQAFAACSADFFRDYAVNDLLPFWLKNGLDRDFGGFNTQLDRFGRPRGQSEKGAAKQGRMIHAFVLGHRLSGRSDFLEAARYGFEFLTDHMWDSEEEGWFSFVARDGSPTSTVKNPIHHWYVLQGLASFYGATSDPRALDHACRTWIVLERRMRDPLVDGYSLDWSRDWEPINPAKDLGTLVNCTKALLELAAATGESVYMDRADAILRLIQTRLFDPRSGLPLEYWHKDWRYFPLPVRDRIDLGHVLEAGWLMIAAGHRSGVRFHQDWGLRIIDRVIEVGWDRRHGGLHSWISRKGMVPMSTKIWWTQCEGISALAHAWAATWDVGYLRYLAALTDFCWNSFVDPEHGEWYTTCRTDGRPLDMNKGGSWKGAYHQMEAAYYAATLLRRDQKPADARK